MINSRAALIIFFFFFVLLVNYKDTSFVEKFFYYHVRFTKHLDISLALQRNKFVIFVLTKFDISTR